MAINWTDYLGAPGGLSQHSECRQRCRGSYKQQRKNIQRLIEAMNPRVVACLGAGVLNDIPYRELVQSGARIHLVDWVPGSIDVGIQLSILRDDGVPHCIFCHSSVTCPQKYCSQYRTSSTGTVCDRFVPSPDKPLRCLAFQKGECPEIYYQDVTSGYANEFGRRVLGELGKVRSWRQAFRRATQLSKRMRSHRSLLPIADSSVHLVTSSMLLSQFEHEPYGYFSYRAAELLGPPKANEEKRILPSMELLRSTLFLGQIERHFQEIDRILAPDGRCYVSFEIFHSLPDSSSWFLVKGVPKVVELLERYFFFNFDIIPEKETVTRFQTENQPSLVCSFVLESKSR